MTKKTITCLALISVGLVLISMGCSTSETEKERCSPYTAFSRFTDPGEHSSLLAALPDDPIQIAAVAGNLTVHHNLLPYFGISRDRWRDITFVWPPKAADVLSALGETGPGDLLGERHVTERVRGACMIESHLLACMLRYRRIPARIRAGYFRDVYTNEDHVVAFWEQNARGKGSSEQLLRDDPERWRRENNEFTRRQVAINKRVEHWIVEYRDESRTQWLPLDADTTFLKAMSDIDVGFNLPRRYFEYAFESWKKMRTGGDFNPDQYAESPQDGRSHIRSQLLWDFYSLLNHDIAGFDVTAWPKTDSTTAERAAYAFLKERTYEELSARELEELDALAELLSRDPVIEDLISFYRDSETLRIATIETDPYSYLTKLKTTDRE